MNSHDHWASSNLHILHFCNFKVTIFYNIANFDTMNSNDPLTDLNIINGQN